MTSQGWSQEKILVSARGRWQDKYIYADGREILHPWKPNQIQDTSAELLAGVARRAGESVPFAGFTGLSYLAVGSGDVSWDLTPPTLDQTDTTLTNETFRKVINPADMNFVDVGVDFGAPVGVITRKIQVVVTLLSTEANGSLREFALFGGDANGAANSGLMFNFVRTPRIDKDSSLTIVRTIEILFLRPGECTP